MALIYYNHYLITFIIMISFLIQILSLHNIAVMVGMNTVRTNLFEYFWSSIFRLIIRYVVDKFFLEQGAELRWLQVSRMLPITDANELSSCVM